MRDEVNPESSLPTSPPSAGPDDAESTGAEAEQPLATPDPPDLTDWKDQLRRDFERWLDSIEEIPPGPDDGNDGDDGAEPDLYSFYEELASLSTESRKSNRRTAEAFSQWNEVLNHFQGDLSQLRRLFSERFGPEAETLPRAHCLALLDLLDRVERMAEAFDRPPRPAWWSNDRAWRAAWGTQRGALDILRSHLLALLKKEGIARIATRGAAFDPGTMTAVAAESRTDLPPQTVLEELSPGYACRGAVLRLAQVKVSTRSPDTP
jgi:molecular chaperone GrpE (heat shock protein)